MGRPVPARARADLALAVWGAAVLGLSLLALGFFLHSRIHLDGPDAFYYLSLAESLSDSGALRDLTAVPDRPVRTPQNGVVALYVALGALGLSREAQIVALVLLNYVLHLSGAIPLARLARRLGLAGRLPRAALLGAYLGGFALYRWQLPAYNDGLFNPLSLWLGWGLVAWLQDARGDRARFGALVALSALLVHFRLNTLLLLAAAGAAAALAGRPRRVAGAALLLAVALLSIAPYAWMDLGRIGGESGFFTGEVASGFPTAAAAFTIATPRALLGPTHSAWLWIYAPFAVALALVGVRGLRAREPGALFVVAAIAGAYLLLLAYGWKAPRYLTYVAPLLYLVLLLPRATRALGVGFAGLVLAVSLATYARGYERLPTYRFWHHVRERGLALPVPPPLLLAQRARPAWFFLGAPAWRGPLEWERIQARGGVWLAGDAAYRERQRARLAGLAAERGGGLRTRTLTPDYRDAVGNALVWIGPAEAGNPGGGS